MLKIVHPTRQMKYLSEIGQSLVVKFSFAKVDGENAHRLHEWAKCRDFLGDAVFSKAMKTKADIYNFCCDPDVWQIEDKHTLLLLNFPTKVSRDAFLANYEHIVGEVEKLNKIAKTTVETTDDELTLLVKGHKYWQRTIWLISLYSFLLKASCYPYKNVVEWRQEIVAKGVTESSYALRLQKNWDGVISKLKKVSSTFKDVSGYDFKLFNGTVHNSSGFVAILGTPEVYKQNLYAQRVLEILK